MGNAGRTGGSVADHQRIISAIISCTRTPHGDMDRIDRTIKQTMTCRGIIPIDRSIVSSMRDALFRTTQPSRKTDLIFARCRDVRTK